MSIEKRRHVIEPTEEEIDKCEHAMSMKQLKDKTNGIFARLPKSVVIRGRRTPRTLLRKRDLCYCYLAFGGDIKPKQPRNLKYYTPSKKASKEQRRYESLLRQRALDHKGKVPSTHKASNKKIHGDASLSSFRKNVHTKKKRDAEEDMTFINELKHLKLS